MSKTIKTILDVIELDTNSAQDFNEALSSISPSVIRYRAKWLNTPLGAMLAIAGEQALFMLDFHDRHNLASIVKRLFADDALNIGAQQSFVIDKLEQELKQYFSGEKMSFKTPVIQIGTSFQLASWAALTKVPYGETQSYQEQAHTIGHTRAHRAVANANGQNKVAIVIPCHRIIRQDGTLGGYGGRVDRKKWLLDLEGRNAVVV